MKFALVVKEGSYGPEFKVDGEGRLYAESRKDYSLLVVENSLFCYLFTIGLASLKDDPCHVGHLP